MPIVNFPDVRRRFSGRTGSGGWRKVLRHQRTMSCKAKKGNGDRVKGPCAVVGAKCTTNRYDRKPRGGRGGRSRCVAKRRVGNVDLGLSLTDTA